MSDNYRGMQLLTENPDEGALNWDNKRVFTVGNAPPPTGASMSGPAPTFSKPLPPEPQQVRAHQAPASKRTPEKPKMSEAELMEWADKAIANVRKDEERSMAGGPAVNGEGTGYAQEQPFIGPPEAPRAPRMAPEAHAAAPPVMMPRNDASLPARQLEASRGMGGSKSVTVPTSQAHFYQGGTTNAEITRNGDTFDPVGRIREKAGQMTDNDRYRAARDTVAKQANSHPGSRFVKAGAEKAIKASLSYADWLNKKGDYYKQHPSEVPLQKYDKPVYDAVQRGADRVGNWAVEHSSTLREMESDRLERRIKEAEEELKKNKPRDEGEVD